MAYQSLKEILDINLQLDKKFHVYLSNLARDVKEAPLKMVLETLRDRLDHDWESVLHLEENDFGSVEFIKEVPDTKIEDYFPGFEAGETSDPVKFITRVLEFEEKQLTFYTQLKEKTAYTKSKEICDMMIKFKMGQIKGIERVLENHNLAI